MAIVQISKIQQRTGNIVDLPQLDNAELGWASDARQLFIGNDNNITGVENVEVLTSYSTIDFDQLNGSYGNLDIDGANITNGQVLTYDGNNWTNRGGSIGGLITLGDVSNVKINGGAIGYVLETDGTGNLAWTPKGTLYTQIIALSNETPIVMTVANTTPYTNDTLITITGADGANANSIVNGQSFYVQLAVDYATSGNVRLYTGTGGTGPVNGTNLGASTPNVGLATSVISGVGGGAGAAGGSDYSVQFNNTGVIDGGSQFTWNYSTNVLTVNGNTNVGNLNATSTVTATRLISNIATGTAPFTVTSTTRVANLNVSYANVSDFEVVTAQNTGTFYPVFVNGNTSANYALGSNANISFNAATGALSATLLGGTLTTATQPNVTSLGTLTSLNVNATVNAVAFSSNVSTGTAPLTVSSTTKVTNLNADLLDGLDTASAATVNTVVIRDGNGNINANNISGTLTTAAQNNITSVGTLTSLIVSGTANLGTTLTTLLTSGANTTAGTITGNWTLSSGSRLIATYADLAEYYSADTDYEPGTVLEFGGEQEVTIASDGTNKVAGVVSTNPAYVMNGLCTGVYPVAIALQGRVPVKVRGKINKGDFMVSGGNGYARPSSNPQIGTVIGKSLQNFDGIGIIEIAVGRL